LNHENLGGAGAEPAISNVFFWPPDFLLVLAAGGVDVLGAA
jgi:hypothetical protein